MTRRLPLVHIHYRRPPDRLEVFTQRLLLDAPDVKVTLAQSVSFDFPVLIQDRVALEQGSDAVWFTFPGLWHDIGRFHRANGTFTGLYANILTPPLFPEPGTWETTDLFLDLWLNPQGELLVLDVEELEEAERRGWVTPRQAERARQEVRRIRKMWEANEWPPPIVEEWTRERALQLSSATTHAAQRRPRSR